MKCRLPCSFELGLLFVLPFVLQFVLLVVSVLLVRRCWLVVGRFMLDWPCGCTCARFCCCVFGFVLVLRSRKLVAIAFASVYALLLVSTSGCLQYSLRPDGVREWKGVWRLHCVHGHYTVTRTQIN